MHPAFLFHWKKSQSQKTGCCGEELRAEQHDCCGSSSCESDSCESRGDCCEAPQESCEQEVFEQQCAQECGDDGGSSFGVRRPLRFIAYKLGLSEMQVTHLAEIINTIKTERAQSAVDDRRAQAAFAAALEGEKFLDEQAGSGATTRVQSSERLQKVIVESLKQMHQLLNEEQRAKLAYLVRTGTVIF
jgi:hypothetical protein